MKKFILLLFSLGLLLCHTVSYGELEGSSLENQASELQFSETLNSSKSSLLSLKLELAGGLIYSFFPLWLEFQTPILMENKNLKWLIQAGVGTVYFPFTGFLPFFPIDTGLRYDFRPFTFTLKGGAWLIPHEKIGDFKVALAFGWNIANTVHLEFSFGLLSILNAGPFVSLSASVPIQQW